MSLDEWSVCMDDWIDVWKGGWDGQCLYEWVRSMM